MSEENRLYIYIYVCVCVRAQLYLEFLIYSLGMCHLSEMNSSYEMLIDKCKPK